MFCSEGFSEKWREYVASLLNLESKNALLSTYGSSEFLLTAYENPLTVAIRTAAQQDESWCEEFFGGPAVPSLFQFNPLSRFIESIDGELVVTAAAGVPLIRFNQHDMGVVIPHQEVERMLHTKGILKEEFKKAWRWPFVTLFGRSDRTLVLYAANIYPEHIQLTLSDARYLKLFTGKFFMEKKQLPDLEQELVIHIELCPGVRGLKGLEKQVQHHVVEELKRINIEYRDASTMLGGRKMTPRILLHPTGDPVYFTPGLKPRFMAPR